MNMYHARVLQFPCHSPMHGNAQQGGHYDKGDVFQVFQGS